MGVCQPAQRRPQPLYSKLARCIRVRFEFEADAEEVERKMLVPWRLGQLSNNIILVGIRLTSQIMATKARLEALPLSQRTIKELVTWYSSIQEQMEKDTHLT